jgi:hypothetical protein
VGKETPRQSRRSDTAPVPESKSGSRVSAHKEGGKIPSVVVTPSLRRQIDREALPPAPVTGPAAAAPKAGEAAVETLTDSRGIKARVVQRGEKLPKLACILIIED